MQKPTCTNIRIRSTQDAHRIFFAIQRGLLHMVTRRLDADERLALTTGCVYAWEERGPHAEITGLGIERFTEGRRWSPSRVRDEFLFYYEKYTPPLDANSSGNTVEQQPPRGWDPLVKQTYSVWVETDKGRRKWHLTAYFTQATIDGLGTIDDIPGVRELISPDESFMSTRAVKARGKADEQLPRHMLASPKPMPSISRTYAPFPPLHDRHPSQSQSPLELQPVVRFDQYGSLRTPARSDIHSSQHLVAVPAPQRASNQEPCHSHDQRGQAVISPMHHLQSSAIDSRYRPGPGPLIHTQGSSSSSARSYSSASPAAHGSPLDHQYHILHPATGQFHRSPSPIMRNGMSVQDTYSDRQPSFNTREETAAPYAHNPVHDPSTFYSYSPAGAIPATNLHVPHSNSVPPHESQASGPAFSGPSIILPPHGDQGPHSPSYELLPTQDPSTSESLRGSIGPDRDLAPIYVLARPHPYRRDPVDDKTLRLLTPRSP